MIKAIATIFGPGGDPDVLATTPIATGSLISSVLGETAHELFAALNRLHVSGTTWSSIVINVTRDGAIVDISTNLANPNETRTSDSPATP